MKKEAITQLPEVKNFNPDIECVLKRVNSYDIQEYYSLTKSQTTPSEVNQNVLDWLNRMEEKYELSINW